ncbi:hypothetical protein HDU99_005654, partial [Rhizoclosmatium hyalinum]
KLDHNLLSGTIPPEMKVLAPNLDFNCFDNNDDYNLTRNPACPPPEPCKQLNKIWPQVFTDPNAKCCSFGHGRRDLSERGCRRSLNVSCKRDLEDWIQFSKRADCDPCKNPCCIPPFTHGGGGSLVIDCNGFQFQGLTLDSSTFDDSLPDFSGVYGLKNLRIINGQFTGSIPKLPKDLKVLDLSGNRLGAGDGYPKDPNVYASNSVKISGNCFTGDPTPNKNCPVVTTATTLYATTTVESTAATSTVESTALTSTVESIALTSTDASTATSIILTSRTAESATLTLTSFKSSTSTSLIDILSSSFPESSAPTSTVSDFTSTAGDTPRVFSKATAESTASSTSMFETFSTDATTDEFSRITAESASTTSALLSFETQAALFHVVTASFVVESTSRSGNTILPSYTTLTYDSFTISEPASTSSATMTKRPTSSATDAAATTISISTSRISSIMATITSIPIMTPTVCLPKPPPALIASIAAGPIPFSKPMQNYNGDTTELIASLNALVPGSLNQLNANQVSSSLFQITEPIRAGDAPVAFLGAPFGAGSNAVVVLITSRQYKFNGLPSTDNIQVYNDATCSFKINTATIGTTKGVGFSYVLDSTYKSEWFSLDLNAAGSTLTVSVYSENKAIASIAFSVSLIIGKRADGDVGFVVVNGVGVVNKPVETRSIATSIQKSLISTSETSSVATIATTATTSTSKTAAAVVTSTIGPVLTSSTVITSRKDVINTTSTIPKLEQTSNTVNSAVSPVSTVSQKLNIVASKASTVFASTFIVTAMAMVATM